jgi:2-polyprenyl-6-methoxyphenol hydroxylase-like FAD-dependent oxidoreductase
MKNSSREILIIGAGFAGLSTAIFLKRAGFPVRVFESSAHQRHAGGGIVLSPNGMRALRKMNLANSFIAAGNVMKRTIFLNKSEDLLIEKHFADEAIYGEPSVFIRRKEAHNILTQAALGEQIEIEYSKKLVSIQQESDFLIAHFSDGSNVLGEILIGADGAGSLVRNFVLNHHEFPLIFQKLVYAGGFIDDPSFISERSLPIDIQKAIIGNKGVFAYEHIHNSSLAPSLYWGTFFGARERASRQEINSLTLEEKKTVVKKSHDSYPDIVTHLIDKSEDIILAPISDINELPTWSNQRVLLIGDAAHAVSPIIGLGINMSLEDAQMLSELCLLHKMNYPLVFKDFELLRKSRVTKIINTARRSSRISQVNLGVLNYFRNFLFSLIVKLANREKENWIYSYSVEKEILNLRKVI